MKVTQVKCVKCGLIYEREGNSFCCPRCKEQIFDSVIGYLPDQRPILSASGLLWNWPYVKGLPITSLN